MLMMDPYQMKRRLASSMILPGCNLRVHHTTGRLKLNPRTPLILPVLRTTGKPKSRLSPCPRMAMAQTITTKRFLLRTVRNHIFASGNVALTNPKGRLHSRCHSPRAPCTCPRRQLYITPSRTHPPGNRRLCLLSVLPLQTRRTRQKMRQTLQLSLSNSIGITQEYTICSAVSGRVPGKCCVISMRS
jgi:hypothetical protein